MKKYFLGICAFAIAFAFSAFTVKHTNSKKLADKWVMLKAGKIASDELVFSNYDVLPGTPDNDNDCPAENIVCAFKVPDLNSDNIIQESEFDAKADVLDTSNNGIISDDQNEGTTSDYFERGS